MIVLHIPAWLAGGLGGCLLGISVNILAPAKRLSVGAIAVRVAATLALLFAIMLIASISR